MMRPRPQVMTAHGRAGWAAALRRGQAIRDAFIQVGLYPIVTSQYSSTTLYKVSYHIQSLFFLK